MYLGVDFGTTYSRVAYKHEDSVKVLTKHGVDSVFYYDIISAEERKIDYIKSLKDAISKKAINDGKAKSEEEISREVDGIIEKIEKWQLGTVGNAAFRYVEYENDFNNLVRYVKLDLGEEFELDGETFTSEEIIKAIYHEVIFNVGKKRGEEYLPDFKVDGVVLSHPAYFDLKSVNALCTAAKGCSVDGTPLNVVGTVKEPVAAAINYFESNPNIADGECVLVYDLGGSACNVTLIRKNSKYSPGFDVIYADMVNVGGRDWDRALFNYIASEIEEMTDGECIIYEDNETKNEVYKEIKDVKHTLSLQENAIFRTYMTYHPAINKGIEITKEAFETVTSSLLSQTIELLYSVYNECKNKFNIKRILCVGGASNMPMVEKTIKEQLSECDVVVVNEPENAVVKGAAIYANSLQKASNIDASKKTVDEEEIDGDLEEAFDDEEAEDDLDEAFDDKEEIDDDLEETDDEAPQKENVLLYSYGIRCVKNGKPLIRNILKKGSKLPAVGKCEFVVSAKSVKLEIFETSREDDFFAYDEAEATLFGTAIIEFKKSITKKERFECEMIMNSLSDVTIQVSCSEKDSTNVTFNRANKK